ncbi:endonuclease III [Candidatus Pacearchaeota archaeon]|nr:endonuclease III [Candidatus Pacearchaeota archaeon]
MEIKNILNILEKHFHNEQRTTLNSMRGEDPFKVLVGCIVSINIKDEVTNKILEELFSKVRDFNELLEMDNQELENILYLARYRKVKARTLKNISKVILEKYNGKVPNTKEELLSIKGIGPKTASVVLNFAFNKPFIPVDSNTLRIANRIGWIKTNKNEEVERLLMESLNEDMIRKANAIFMLHGKNICVPVSPFCSKCPVNKFCKKIGVEKWR